MKIILFLSVLSLATSGTISAQEFLKEYSAPALYHIGHSVIQTTDGGYLLAGTKSVAQKGWDGLLIKTDANGNKQWEKTYSISNHDASDIFFDVCQVSDGGYIATGHGEIGFGDTKDWFLAVKFNSNGDTVWSVRQLGYIDAEGRGIQPTSDGGALIVGYKSFQDAGVAAHAWKISSTGAIEWGKKLVDGPVCRANDISKTSDGGYIIAGYLEYEVPGLVKKSGFIQKITATADTIWTKLYADELNGAKETSDGGLVTTGKITVMNPFTIGTVVIRTNSSGEAVWQKTYETGTFHEGEGVAVDNNGNIGVAGYTTVKGKRLFYFLKLNSSGDTLCTARYGNGNINEAMDIETASDGSFIITGYRDMFHAVLIKTNDCSFESATDIHVEKINTKIEVYPNPTFENITITFPQTFALNKSKLVVRDITGREMFLKELSADENSYTFSLKEFPVGVYILEVHSGGEVFTQQVSVVK